MVYAFVGGIALTFIGLGTIAVTDPHLVIGAKVGIVITLTGLAAVVGAYTWYAGRDP